MENLSSASIVCTVMGIAEARFLEGIVLQEKHNIYSGLIIIINILQ